MWLGGECSGGRRSGGGVNGRKEWSGGGEGKLGSDEGDRLSVAAGFAGVAVFVAVPARRVGRALFVSAVQLIQLVVPVPVTFLRPSFLFTHPSILHTTIVVLGILGIRLFFIVVV